MRGCHVVLGWSIATLLGGQLACGKVTGCKDPNLHERQRCLRQQAIKRHEPDLCNVLGRLDTREECMEAVAHEANDPGLCSSIPRPQARDKCVKTLARKPEDCARIANPFRRDECLSEIALVGDGIVAACESIDNTDRRDDCYVDLATQNNAPEDVCERVKSRQSACWSNLARLRDPAFCERVSTRPGSAARRTCYVRAVSDVPANKLNTAYCSKIGDIRLQQDCQLRVVAASQDVRACEEGKFGERTDECWAAVAQRDADLCLRIADTGHQRYCAMINWRHAKDPAVCKLLLVAGTRAECLMKTESSDVAK
ncbi:MAG TPA: hypothetical protein VHM70_25085 [Polyangiaceae bacterium]|nr:hypothetical protein [Polyangiaceae bacterium]